MARIFPRLWAEHTVPELERATRVLSDRVLPTFTPVQLHAFARDIQALRTTAELAALRTGRGRALRAEFLRFCEGRDPGEVYDFCSHRGDCAWGQFMASRGLKWNYNDYRREVRAAFPSAPLTGVDEYVLADTPWTWGALTQRVREYA